jgi:hypothetical protein
LSSEGEYEYFLKRNFLRSLQSWFWLSPDDRKKPAPWPIVVLIWALAFVLVTMLYVFSFSRLTYNCNWRTVRKYENFFRLSLGGLHSDGGALLCPTQGTEAAERWYADCALEDLLGVPCAKVNESRLYRGVDVLHHHKDQLCAHLLER